MLPSHYQELLTAYVDGELSARQKRNVARLLRRSGEARALLHKLQTDSRDLHLLPVRTPAVDLSEPVLAAIHQRQLKPVRRPRLAPPPRSFPAWTGIAAAAAVLLLVGFASFLITSRHPGRPASPVAHRPEVVPEAPVVPVPDGPKNVARAPREKEEPKKTPVLPDLPPRTFPVEPLAPTPEKDRVKPLPVKPAPELPSDPVLASGQKEGSSQLERVELALPVIFKLDELEQTAPAGKLRKQLASAAAFRIELLCKDATRAYDRIKPSLAGQKIGVVVDPAAHQRLKKPQFKHDFALFFENVTPEQLVEILARAGRLDRTASAGKKTSEIRFDGAVVVKAIADSKTARHDRQELRELLGVDPISVRPTPAGPAPKVDIRRPLQESTEARVAAALDGKAPPRPTTAASGKNMAMVLALSASRGVRSPEVKRFLEARKPARPGTVQVFLVLRNVGS